MDDFDDGLGTSEGNRWGTKKGRDYVRIGKFVIMGGFIVIGVIVFNVFITTSGVNIEISEQNQLAGIQTINIRISNNQLSTLNDVTVQFGDQGRIQKVGSMGPYSSVAVTPDQNDLNFEKIIVRGNDGHSNFDMIRFRK
jgi:hypothetical protein